jgi:hypothetical protein
MGTPFEHPRPRSRQRIPPSKSWQAWRASSASFGWFVGLIVVLDLRCFGFVSRSVLELYSGFRVLFGKFVVSGSATAGHHHFEF